MWSTRALRKRFVWDDLRRNSEKKSHFQSKWFVHGAEKIDNLDSIGIQSTLESCLRLSLRKAKKRVFTERRYRDIVLFLSAWSGFLLFLEISALDIVWVSHLQPTTKYSQNTTSLSPNSIITSAKHASGDKNIFTWSHTELIAPNRNNKNRGLKSHFQTKRKDQMTNTVQQQATIGTRPDERIEYTLRSNENWLVAFHLITVFLQFN